MTGLRLPRASWLWSDLREAATEFSLIYMLFAGVHFLYVCRWIPDSHLSACLLSRSLVPQSPRRLPTSCRSEANPQRAQKRETRFGKPQHASVGYRGMFAHTEGAVAFLFQLSILQRTGRLTLLGPQFRFGDNWGQITWNLTGVSPERDWSSSKRVRVANQYP